MPNHCWHWAQHTSENGARRRASSGIRAFNADFTPYCCTSKEFKSFAWGVARSSCAAAKLIRKIAATPANTRISNVCETRCMFAFFRSAESNRVKNESSGKNGLGLSASSIDWVVLASHWKAFFFFRHFPANPTANRITRCPKPGQ